MKYPIITKRGGLLNTRLQTLSQNSRLKEVYKFNPETGLIQPISPAKYGALDAFINYTPEIILKWK